MVCAVRLSAGRLFLAFGLVALLARPTGADVLDQSNVVGTASFDGNLSNFQSLAQTFTVGVTGQLSRIGFQVYHNTGASGDLTLQILSTSGGVPDPNTASAIFQTIVPLTSTPTLDSPTVPPSVPITLVDVSSANIMVTPGQVFTIALRSPNGAASRPWTIWRAGGNDYAGGAEFIQSSGSTTWTPLSNVVTGQDLGFQTYVNAAPIPETGAATMLAGMCLAGGVFLRRYRKAA